MKNISQKYLKYMLPSIEKNSNYYGFLFSLYIVPSYPFIYIKFNIILLQNNCILIVYFNKQFQLDNDSII